jgi:hypothetical protein
MINVRDSVIVQGPLPGRLNRIVLSEESLFAVLTASSNEPAPWLFVLVTTRSAKAELKYRPDASSNKQRRR